MKVEGKNRQLCHAHVCVRAFLFSPSMTERFSQTLTAELFAWNKESFCCTR
jgi:hypothetical protein